MLRQFKETGNTDYAISGVMLAQVRLSSPRRLIKADFLFSGVQMRQGGELSDVHYT